jgi:hypothetical protein
VTETLADLVQKYWIVIAGVILLWTDPTRLKVLLSRVGLAGNPLTKSTSDYLDLVNELARANRDGGFGADEEIQKLYQKFSASPKGMQIR